jgi:hypothetical protein
MELSNKEFIDDREPVLSNRTLDITLAGQHKKKPSAMVSAYY